MAGARFLAVASAVGSAVALPAGNPNSCNLYGPGVTYLANNLYSAVGDWTFASSFSIDSYNYSYTFQVCGDVNNMPLACSSAGAPSAPAYQWISGTSTCIPLGATTQYSVSPIQTSLLDNANPANGMSLTYAGGAPCTVGTGTVNRQFSLQFSCATFPGAFSPGTYNFSFVEEVNTCQYQAFLYSSAGCPQECPVAPNGRLCSDNGICGYDKNLNSGTGGARCFCDDDFMDADCSNPRSPFPTGPVAGSVIGGMALGAASIFGFSYARSLRAAPAVDGFYGQVQ